MRTRRWLRWASRRYPRAWRNRYGDEFETFLDALPEPGWATVWDVWKGAIDMQLHHNGRKVWTWTALLAVVGCVTAAGISMRIPNRYRSVAVIELIGGVEEKKLSAVLQKVFAAERLQPLIDKHRLYSREQASDQVQTVLTKITRDISMGRVAHLQGGRKAFSISFEYDDPHAAQSVVRELTQAFREEHAQANAGGGGTLSMLDAPSLPLAPYYPSRRNIAFVGLLAGAAVGVLCAAVQLRMCGLSSR